MTEQHQAIQAIVLVGGQGTRLRPLTLTTPKPLVPLANRAVIEHIVAWLEAQGIAEALLATQYRAADFERWLRRWRRQGGMPVQAISEPEPRGTAGAVAHLAERLHGPVVVVNGDNLLQLDLRAMLAFHRRVGAQVTIAVDDVVDPTGRGVVVCDAQGRVSQFQEKPAPGTAYATTVNTGVYILEAAAVTSIPRGRCCSFEQDVFPALIAAGIPVWAFRSRHIWIDTGTPDGYLRAQAAVLTGEASAPAGVELTPGVWVEDNVTLDSAAQLGGGVALGYGSVVAAGSRIDASSIGRECHVLGATVERSAIWDGSLLEATAIVRDSIIGYNCYIGAGARIVDAVLGDGCVLRAGAVVTGARLEAGMRR
ncbi:sugar phosphate nucleotidyltransferase [Kallotenue papyrolyticum]|uniref:sugar phosphate nucleotidyltransferase n=1 Tax=Kallotenue papyrolyticum TaxID=1325125 RepID=UPI0004AD4544|nr:NDP-sugar synthase [Kallotenue papyrolyticum]